VPVVLGAIIASLSLVSTTTSAPPIVPHEAVLRARDGSAGDAFGEWLAMDGDTLVVGAVAANGDRGAAYVFTRSGSSWTEQARLIAADGGKGDRFGTAVSISQDTVAVSSRKNDEAGDNAGAAYVFVRSGSSWNLQKKLTAPDADPDDKFGDVVSIKGDTLVVGARSDNVAGNESGSAYVFVRSGSTWSLQDTIFPADGRAGDKFADSVALDRGGDVLVAGAPFGDAKGRDSGSAYVFVRSGDNWTEEAKLVPSDSDDGDQAGFKVALDGDTAVLGSPYHDGPGNDSGAAYVFTTDSGGWSQRQKLLGSATAAGDVFGFSVRIVADRVVVGARLEDDAVLGDDSGAAYLFESTGPTWDQVSRLTAPNGAADDEFGDAVEIYGDTIAVGAPGDDGGRGSTDVFRLQVSGAGSLRSRQAWPAIASPRARRRAPSCPRKRSTASVASVSPPRPPCRYAPSISTRRCQDQNIPPDSTAKAASSAPSTYSSRMPI